MVVPSVILGSVGEAAVPCKEGLHWMGRTKEENPQKEQTVSNHAHECIFFWYCICSAMDRKFLTLLGTRWLHSAHQLGCQIFGVLNNLAPESSIDTCVCHCVYVCGCGCVSKEKQGNGFKEEQEERVERMKEEVKNRQWLVNECGHDAGKDGPCMCWESKGVRVERTEIAIGRSEQVEIEGKEKRKEKKEEGTRSVFILCFNALLHCASSLPPPFWPSPGWRWRGKHSFDVTGSVPKYSKHIKKIDCLPALHCLALLPAIGPRRENKNTLVVVLCLLCPIVCCWLASIFPVLCLLSWSVECPSCLSSLFLLLCWYFTIGLVFVCLMLFCVVFVDVKFVWFFLFCLSMTDTPISVPGNTYMPACNAMLGVVQRCATGMWLDAVSSQKSRYNKAA